MAYRNPIVGIKNHSPSTGTIPIKPRRRLAITPGTRMNTFLLRDLSDKNPPNGPPTMLAKRRSEDNKPAVPNGTPLTSWRNFGKNWAAVNVPPHKPSTPNAITQMFRLLRTGLIELYAGREPLSLGTTTSPITKNNNPSNPPSTSPIRHPNPGAFIMNAQTQSPIPPPTLNAPLYNPITKPSSCSRNNGVRTPIAGLKNRLAPTPSINRERKR